MPQALQVLQVRWDPEVLLVSEGEMEHLEYRVFEEKMVLLVVLVLQDLLALLVALGILELRDKRVTQDPTVLLVSLAHQGQLDLMGSQVLLVKLVTPVKEVRMEALELRVIGVH